MQWFRAALSAWVCAFGVTTLLTVASVMPVVQSVAVVGVCAHDPAARVNCYPHVENFPDATEEACLAQGCCWKALNNSGVPCAFDALGAPMTSACARMPKASRIACRNPRFAIPVEDEGTCGAIGCCFDATSSDCFQPFFEGYELLRLEETSSGWRGLLVLRRFSRGPFGNDIPLLQLHVTRESTARVRIRITDPSVPRYEVPDVPIPDYRDDEVHAEAACDYQIHFTERPFGVAVTRRNTSEVLFNSTPPVEAARSFNGLVFENQFLEISTQLKRHRAVGSPVLYGLGERWGRARVRADEQGDHYPMFSRKGDEGTGHSRDGGDNLGGVHPFYLNILDSGRSHGVFYVASNAMEFVTQDNALTFRTVGGVLDFFVFTGPSVNGVTDEYTQVVGRPAMPPFWALGYHLGKRGVSLSASVGVVAKMRVAGIPLDAYWQDRDYMFDNQAFTLDDHLFPQHKLKIFVDDLHFHNQYYVIFQTPAVPSEPQLGGQGVGSSVKGLSMSHRTINEDYYPLERGMEMDVFVRGVDGERYAEKFVGSQWSVITDFFHPNATAYWGELLNNFYTSVVPFDGIWIDANEPASSCDLAFSAPNNSCTAQSSKRDVALSDDEITMASLQLKGSGGQTVEFDISGGFVRSKDISFPFDPYRQPFTPGQSTRTRGGHGNLNSGTLPMSTVHHSSLHYNLHSLYGHAQAKATQTALNDVLNRRNLAMSRSTFAGDGQFVGHWFGDTSPTWENLQYSISGVVQMNLLGLPLSGPNVCGYGGNTTRELCIRWHQAASFFPLFRNHGDKGAKLHSPVDFDEETVNIMRKTLLRRYKYLPYIYSQLYRAHTQGVPVVKSLAFEFPTEPKALAVEDQYLVGPAVMVSPVVLEHAIASQVYFPWGAWYDAENGRALIHNHTRSRTVQLLTPLSELQVHVRGGHIIPTQQPATTTEMTRRGSYRLVVALDEQGIEPSASGELFIDDGDSLDSIQDSRYSLITFSATVRDGRVLEFVSERAFYGYDGPELDVDLDEIVVLGLHGHFHANSSIHASSDSGHRMKVNFFSHSNILILSRIQASIGQECHFTIKALPAEHAVQGDKSKAEDSAADDQGGDVATDHGQHAEDGDDSDQEEAERPSTQKGDERASNTKGLTTIGIIGVVAGVIFIAGIFAIVLYRRRGGYHPIA